RSRRCGADRIRSIRLLHTDADPTTDLRCACRRKACSSDTPARRSASCHCPRHQSARYPLRTREGLLAIYAGLEPKTLWRCIRLEPCDRAGTWQRAHGYRFPRWNGQGGTIRARSRRRRPLLSADSHRQSRQAGRKCSMTESQKSAASVIICSRNRPTLLKEAVLSIIEGDELPEEIVIVDQSDDPDAALASETFSTKCVIRYV